MRSQFQVLSDALLLSLARCGVNTYVVGAFEPFRNID